jgi:hypothetical protein
MESCHVCHIKIDPLGFGLESFDPIGGWRTHFRSLGHGEPVDFKVAGTRVRYRIGPAVDASGQLADGMRFQGFHGFRQLLARDETELARTLTKKLMTFATGREMGFSDRQAIDQIVERCAESGYGVGDLIEQIVVSETFRRK